MIFLMCAGRLQVNFIYIGDKKVPFVRMRSSPASVA